jgi:uncharacterized membrane protein YeaQ/YmgE (transglycosylase-associated protein family)
MRFVFWIAFGIAIGFAMSRFNPRGSTWTALAWGIVGAIGGGIAVHQFGWASESDVSWTILGAIAGALVLSFIYLGIGRRREKISRQNQIRKAA